MAALATGNAEGRAGLKEVVAEARAELLARLEWVEAVEARRRATAADRAAFDDSASGQRRQRYEAMHARTLRSALRDLRAEQKRRLAEDDITAATVGSGEGGAGDGPEAEPIAPSEPTAEAPSEPTGDPVVAPSEPTGDAGPIAPSEPTEGAGCIAPTEPTEAGDVDGNDDEGQDSGESNVPASAVEGAGGAGQIGTVEGEACRPPAMMAGGVVVRPPSPFRNGGHGPTSVGLGRVHERSW